MKKHLRKNGFTLAELLIVVAIIGVLVAIAIPVFTGQLNKAQLATDQANVRSYCAEQVATQMSDSAFSGSVTIKYSDINTVTQYCDDITSVSGNQITLTHSKSKQTATIPVDSNIVFE